MSMPASIADTLYAWDVALFRIIHTTVPPSSAELALANVFVELPLGLTLLLLVGMIELPVFSMRLIALKAGVLALAAVMVIDLLSGFVWNRPRPCVAGIGYGWISHAATSSFPCGQLTAEWVIAGVLLLNRRTQVWGIVLASLGLPTAWAWIHLGEHYPSDMLGAAVMGCVAAAVAWRWRVSSAKDEVLFGPRA